MLVHRFKKFLFRIVPDPDTGVDMHDRYDMSRGFAGIVAVSGKLLYTEELLKDINFVKELDDPNY